MRAVILSYGDLEIRTDIVKKVLSEYFDSVVTIVSDFDHHSKEYVAPKEGKTYIHVKKYKKNLSVARIQSYIGFSQKAGKLLRKLKPDLVYVQAPPNFLLKVCAKYKKRSNCKLIFDIIDMWPESLPIGKKLRKIMSSVLWHWFVNHGNVLSCVYCVVKNHA